MLQVRRMNDDAFENNRTQQGHTRLLSVLRSLVDRMDGVLIRTLIQDRKDEDLIYYLGDEDRRIPSSIKNTIEVETDPSWKRYIKPGRFLMYKGQFGRLDSGEKYRLVVCLDNINEQDKVTMVSIKTINHREPYIANQSTCDITTDASKKLKPQIKETDYTIDETWDSEKIKVGTILLIKSGLSKRPVICTGIDYHDPGYIRFKYKEFFQFTRKLIVTGNQKNTRILDECDKTKIPFQPFNETLITYPDDLELMEKKLSESPCTFVALYQHEILKGYIHNSIKQYFSNDHGRINEKFDWMLFCGREKPEEIDHTILPVSKDNGERETLAQESDPSHGEIDNSDGDDIDDSDSYSVYDMWNSDPNYQSVSPENTPSPTELSEGRESEPVGTQRSNKVNDGKQEYRLSHTRNNKYKGNHSRVFINLFIVFQHWARFDAEKSNQNAVDRALWDPDHSNSGFDLFFRPKIDNTELRPWMFTVTRILRTWISELATLVGESRGQDRFHVNTETDNGEIDIIDIGKKEIMKEIIDEELENIKQIFSDEVTEKSSFMKQTSDGKYDTIPKEPINPVLAALDYRQHTNYNSFIKRGETILKYAFLKAFPQNTVNGFSDPSIEGVNDRIFTEKGKFFEYLWEILKNYQYEQALTFDELKGRYNPDTTLITGQTLQSLTIPNLIGTYAEKGSRLLEVIKQQPHTPLLFPGLLKKGDILCIYTKQGCTIVKFIRLSLEEKNPSMGEEIEYNEKDRRGNSQRQGRKLFYLRFHSIFYSIDETDEETYELHDFTNVFLLYPKDPSITRRFRREMP